MQALDDPAQFPEVELPWGGLPPGKADLAVRLWRRKRQNLDVAPARFGFQAYAREERDAQPIGDHFNDRGEARGSERIEVFDLLQLAKTQRLIPQAMPLFKKQQAIVFKDLRGCENLRRQPPGRGSRRCERRSRAGRPQRGARLGHGRGGARLRHLPQLAATCGTGEREPRAIQHGPHAAVQRFNRPMR